MTDSLQLEWTGELGRGPAVALAHGAGAPMDSRFMTAFADGIQRHRIPVVRFEFSYMRQRRTEGIRKPPDSAPKLLATWREVIAKIANKGVPPERLVIGGKSMGGRLASMVADEEGVLGLVCLGYPFHPPGKPEKTRLEHLIVLKTPTLFVQGTRDSLGSKDEIKGYRLSRKIRMHWIEDGDHSLKPRKSSGLTEAQAWDEGIGAVADFVRLMARD